MKLKKNAILLFLFFVMSSFTQANDDLFVKIYKDDLKENHKIYLNIFKKATKDVSDKYDLKEYELVILNPYGKTKWKGILESYIVDFEENNIDARKGDQIVIRDIQLRDKKNGKVITIERITERYLIR